MAETETSISELLTAKELARLENPLQPETDMQREARLAAQTIDSILNQLKNTPGVNPSIIKNLEASKAMLLNAADGRGLISQTGPSIDQLLTQAYENLHEAESAVTGELQEECARAANAIAVHQAVERQRQIYSELDNAAWKRVETLSQNWNDKNLDTVCANLIAHNQDLPAATANEVAHHVADFMRQSPAGQVTMVAHNATPAKDRVQAASEGEELSRLMKEAYADPHRSPEMNEALKVAMAGNLNDPRMLQLMQEHRKEKDPQKRKQIEEKFSQTVARAEAESYTFLAENTDKNPGLIEHIYARKEGMSERAGMTDQESTKDMFRNVMYLTMRDSTNSLDGKDKKRFDASTRVLEERAKIKAENQTITDKDIEAKLHEKFPGATGNSEIADANDRIHVAEQVNENFMYNLAKREIAIGAEKCIGKLADLQPLISQINDKTLSSERHAAAVRILGDELIKQNPDYKKLSETSPKYFNASLEKAAASIEERGGINKLIEASHCTLNATEEEKRDPYAKLHGEAACFDNRPNTDVIFTHGRPTKDTLTAAVAAAGTLAQSGAKTSQSPIANTIDNPTDVVSCGTTLNASKVTCTAAGAAPVTTADATTQLANLSKAQPAAGASVLPA